MAYRYCNPGYGNLFDTVNYPSYGTTTQVTKTKTGVGFSTSAGSSQQLNKNINKLSEVWVKFDYYLGYGRDYLLFNVNGGSGPFLTGEAVWNNSNSRNLYYGLPTGNIYTFLVHIKSHATDGVWEVWRDGLQIYRSTGNIYGGSNFRNFNFGSADPSNYISNIIVSDVEIGQTETVIAVPFTATATMTDNGDGTYSATSAGETITMTPDLASLALPDNTIITGVSIAGQPAFYDGEGLYTLVGMKDSTELGDVQLTAVSNNSVSIGINTNLTKNEFAGSTYGWKTKE